MAARSLSRDRLKPVPTLGGRASACPALLQHATNPPPVRGAVDQRHETPLARLLLLRLHHPVRDLAAVAGRLRAPELPRLLVRAEALLVVRRDLARAGLR